MSRPKYLDNIYNNEQGSEEEERTLLCGLRDVPEDMTELLPKTKNAKIDPDKDYVFDFLVKNKNKKIEENVYEFMIVGKEEVARQIKEIYEAQGLKVIVGVCECEDFCLDDNKGNSFGLIKYSQMVSGWL